MDFIASERWIKNEINWKIRFGWELKVQLIWNKGKKRSYLKWYEIKKTLRILSLIVSFFLFQFSLCPCSIQSRELCEKSFSTWRIELWILVEFDTFHWICVLHLLFVCARLLWCRLRTFIQLALSVIFCSIFHCYAWLLCYICSLFVDGEIENYA